MLVTKPLELAAVVTPVFGHLDKKLQKDFFAKKRLQGPASALADFFELGTFMADQYPFLRFTLY